MRRHHLGVSSAKKIVEIELEGVCLQPDSQGYHKRVELT